MKVNFIVDMEKSLRGSGIYSSARRLQQYLIEKGIDVEINGKGQHYDIYHFHTATPRSLLLAKLYQRQKLRKRAIMKRDPWKLLVHGHTTVEDFQNSFFLSNQLVPVVKRHLKSFYKSFDHIIAVSEHNKRIISKLGIKPTQISVISNGIDLNKVTSWDEERSLIKREKILTTLEMPEDSLIIISVGIGFYRKGIDVFVNVGSKLARHLFFWIGHQYPVSFLAQQKAVRTARKVALKRHNIKITGYISRKTLDLLLNTADIFFYPTREENQGIALLEAMALGKAPIVRDHPVFDWLTHGKDCLKGKLTDEFIQHVQTLNDNRNLLSKIQNGARRSVRHHDINETVRKIISLYERVMEEE